MKTLASWWQAAWQTLTHPHQDPTGGWGGFEALCLAYQEPHRHYHTLTHLQECLDGLAEVQHEAQYLDEVIMALWFHDAIYDPHAHDNEHQSAQWASRTLHQALVKPERVQRVVDLVLATRHPSPAQTPDQALLQDLDLAILGSSPERFAAYETQIRQEYHWVPRWLYRHKRRQILKHFAQMQPLYQTPTLYKKLTDQAQSNLKQALLG